MPILKNTFFTLFSLIILIISFGCEDNIDEKQYEIVFSNENNKSYFIYTINLNTNVITSVTPGLSPQYVPNSKNIVFNRDYDIYQISSDGSDEINLTKSAYFECDFSIAKDGSMIVYTSDQDEINNDHRTEIYSLSLKNNEITRLTNSRNWAINAKLSPGLTYLSYFSWDSINNYYSLILKDLYTSTQDTICNDCWTASFSPDENLICYTVANSGLYITNINTLESRLLIAEGFYPKFSPNGKYVYYMTGYNDELIIAKIRTDGSNKTYFPTGQVVAGQYDISADGELIAFVRIKEDNTNWICVINSDGTNLQELSRGYSPQFRR